MRIKSLCTRIIIIESHDGEYYTTYCSNINAMLDEAYRKSHKYRFIGEGNAIFTSGFVTGLADDEGNDEPLIIPLPASIEWDNFILFCKHLRFVVNHPRLWTKDFDRLESLEYLYSPLARGRARWFTSKEDMKRIAKYFLIDMCSNCGIICTEVERDATRNANETSERLPSQEEDVIARAAREIFRNANGRDNENKLSPCNRTSWPNVTAFPVWEDVMIGVHARRQLGLSEY